MQRPFTTISRRWLNCFWRKIKFISIVPPSVISYRNVSCFIKNVRSVARHCCLFTYRSIPLTPFIRKTSRTFRCIGLKVFTNAKPPSFPRNIFAFCIFHHKNRLQRRLLWGNHLLIHNGRESLFQGIRMVISTNTVSRSNRIRYRLSESVLARASRSIRLRHTFAKDDAYFVHIACAHDNQDCDRKQQGHPAKATRHHLQQEMSPMYPAPPTNQVLSAAARDPVECMQDVSPMHACRRRRYVLHNYCRMGNIGSVYILTSINYPPSGWSLSYYLTILQWCPKDYTPKP